MKLEGAPESITSVGLTELRTRIAFDNTLIYPARNEAGEFKISVPGGTVLSADQVNENSLEIDIEKNAGMSDGDLVFTIEFNTVLSAGAGEELYTSPLEIYSYPVDFDNSDPIGVSKSYCVIRDVPGKVVVDQKLCRRRSFGYCW